MTSSAQLEKARSHPVYCDLVGRYRLARRMWSGNATMRSAARLVGMHEREYCDRYIAYAFGPLTWTASRYAADITQQDMDAAYMEAVFLP